MGKEKIRNERELGELERGVRKERKEGRRRKKGFENEGSGCEVSDV